MIRRKLKKIHIVFFYVNLVLGFVAIIQNVYLFFSSSYVSSYLFNIGFILLIIINNSPHFLNFQLKLNYPARIAEMQSEDGKTTDIEFIYFIILPTMFCLYLLFLFFKTIWKLWIL